jgi:transglutaminase-like putative cysteine protease
MTIGHIIPAVAQHIPQPTDVSSFYSNVCNIRVYAIYLSSKEETMGQAHIQKSIYCDFDHPAVLSLAKDLANNEPDPVKTTRLIFEHIRDNIRFGFDLVQVKASETLAKGYGVCWNKSLLLVALLHSNKIPARMAYNPVKQEFMRPAMGEACQTLTETINHCFSQVQLNGKWISVDATLDTATFQKLFKPHQVCWGIDWDGEKDMQLYTEAVLAASRVTIFQSSSYSCSYCFRLSMPVGCSWAVQMTGR